MVRFESHTEEFLQKEYQLHKSFVECSISGNNMISVSWNGLHTSHVLFEKNNMAQILMRDSRHCYTDFLLSDLRCANFSNSFFEKVSFVKCDLIKMDVSNSYLYCSTIEECSAESLNLSRSRIIKSNFLFSELYKLNCENTFILHSEFIVDNDKSFWGLQKASFRNSVMINCLFRGVEYMPEAFSNTVQINCRFE